MGLSKLDKICSASRVGVLSRFLREKQHGKNQLHRVSGERVFSGPMVRCWPIRTPQKLLGPTY
jgi:hypothetical protein